MEYMTLDYINTRNKSISYTTITYKIPRPILVSIICQYWFVKPVTPVIMLHISAHSANSVVRLTKGILAINPIGKENTANVTRNAGPASNW